MLFSLWFAFIDPKLLHMVLICCQAAIAPTVTMFVFLSFILRSHNQLFGALQGYVGCQGDHCNIRAWHFNFFFCPTITTSINSTDPRLERQLTNQLPIIADPNSANATLKD